MQSTIWANGSNGTNQSTWANRVASFTSPTSSLGFTWSISGYSSKYTVNLSWTIIPGVDTYLISTTKISGSTGSLCPNGLVTQQGWPYQGPNGLPSSSYTILNSSSTIQSILDFGSTYTIQLTAKNVAGSTSSTATIYFT